MMLSILLVATFSVLSSALSYSTKGIEDLVKRRLPEHADAFEFRLLGNSTDLISSKNQPMNDEYSISSTADGKILVQGNSPIALSSGLHRYLTDVVHVDVFWFIGSQLHHAPNLLPRPATVITGSSIVPWRYHFNTVTFSYTAAFWSWEDWELELDWMALRGVNLPLAWVGYEKILLDMYRELGLTDEEIFDFFSGPAFQSWNRFGNIQGSWGGDLPLEWVNSQFELQKNITKRIFALGMTPALPAFTGFVPRAITRVLPNATVANGSQWGYIFPKEYTEVTFLEPFDPAFQQLQKNFVAKQTEAYGDITHIYTLDQFNENLPGSGELDYLRSVSTNVWKSLKGADPNAIWLMQGWLFFANSEFWNVERIEAYLGGVENENDMLILDLFSESYPQWQRTNSYFGKNWIWCQLHDYGGSMGLYGQIENITINSIDALADSSSLVGFGLTMEGQEGNEIIYDLLLDQAWSASPIETKSYFHNWVTKRYSGAGFIPEQLYSAWEIMRFAVYNNTNLTSATAVTRSIAQLSPNITGLLGRTYQYGGTTTNYDPVVLVSAWTTAFDAARINPSLWDHLAYLHDMTDITRQVLENSFIDYYNTLISTYTSPARSNTTISSAGQNLTSHLQLLDRVLLTNPAFSLSTWLNAARAQSSNVSVSDFYEFQARNQITLWGPNAEISDYASKSWGGLVGGYYIPRWEIFVQYLLETELEAYNTTELNARLRAFEKEWESSTTEVRSSKIVGSLKDILEETLVAI
ncbi:putative alpha-N-acetylglucosaminidase [Bisporella sp. PMI_857]|nr:putative alpha-N-acetylglucosaminidase [Bisporella sp. PMI_857]